MSNTSPPRKLTLQAIRQLGSQGRPVAMLTCYDYTMARLMEEAGVPALLVGDSAASVILGHPTTLPVTLDFMIAITAAVRRGAPDTLVMADMPFGSYHASVEQGVANVVRMVQETGCDCVKLEVDPIHLPLIHALAASGVAVVAHIGLRPQTIGRLGGYYAQGRNAINARQHLALALQCEQTGAAAILLEAVPPEVTAAIRQRVALPIIGCGAGPDCHACVIVTHDGLGMTGVAPKFVPQLAQMGEAMKAAFGRYMSLLADGAYPAAEHNYSMPPAELAEFERLLAVEGVRP